MKLERHWLGVLQISLASVGFGFLGVFGKTAFQEGLSVGHFLTYRFTLASLLLWTFCLLLRPQSIKLGWKQIGISALLGILGYALFSSLYFTAIKGISVALAALLLYTYPFWVSLLSHFVLNERMTPRQWLCLCAAFSGLLLLLWGHWWAHSLQAVLAGLGAALAYSIYILVSARFQKHVEPLSSSLYVITFSALTLALIHRPSLAAALDLSTAQASSIIGVALIGTILPLSLVLAGLQKMKSSEASLLTMLEPVTAALLAWFIFGESLTLLQLSGALVILISLTVRTLVAK